MKIHPASLVVVLMSGIASCLRVAIIGGGVGGTSTAYHLRQIFGSSLSVALYEMNEIGGRLALSNIDGKYYESGGAVIHTRNHYAMQLIKDFGLEHCETSGDTFGITDGLQLLFGSSRWSYLTTMKLFWRYGYDIIRLNRLINNYIDKFVRVYGQLDSGSGYDDVASLISAMDPSMIHLMNVPLVQYLKMNGFKEAIISELADAAVRVNYGQSTSVHALVGMIALAGAGSELTCVASGNKNLATEALLRSLATLRSEQVHSVTAVSGGRYIVTSSPQSQQPPDQYTELEYDVIVVAAPMTSDHRGSLQWRGFDNQPSFAGRYHNLSVTFVQGQIKDGSIFAQVDDTLCNHKCVDFNSLGKLHPVASTNQSHSADSSDVYKLFSSLPLSDKWLLDKVFSSLDHVQRTTWLAYPHYGSGFGKSADGSGFVPAAKWLPKLPPFYLRRGLYYTSSVESAASAIEMSLIAARNVANLVYRDYGANIPYPSRDANHNHQEL